jgi:hypothetical protein
METDPALAPQRIAVDFAVARTLPALRATGGIFSRMTTLDLSREASLLIQFETYD